MFWSLLPPALVALSLALPAFSTTTTNDPFRAIALLVPLKPEPPICCLVPLPSAEAVEPDILLSFEEWKQKQLAASQQSSAENRSLPTPTENGTAPTVSVALDEAAPSSTSQDAPHFRVPVTDRFNYASLDCSARVHLSHRSAKSPSSILSSKKDRYLLSPCKTPNEKQFVIVELCDDIRIDTVQLANFEFFSGVFKDFTVSVAKTYSTNDEGWTVAGTFRAKNVRGVQTWHPPTSLRDFYRFIRIDFHSHYSNEYYCPISLLRVYGLTHLEEWKWEMWEAESSARSRDGTQPGSSESAPPPIEAVPPSSSSSSLSSSTETEEVTTMPATPTAETGSTEFVTEQRTDSETTTTTTAVATVGISNSTVDTVTQTSIEPTTDKLSIIQNDTTSTSTNEHAPPPTLATSPNTTTTTIIASLPTPSTGSSGGESIYKTIMNRLTALEANHTLYTRYVEEQTSGIREMLRRLGEDVGRIEGIGKAQTQRLKRTIEEWEKQNGRLEMEYRELRQRVDYLSDEIILEKRLGIAQLCLLMTVLIFMALTRGSRADHEQHAPVVIFNKAMREWSRRHLRLSFSRFTSPEKSVDEHDVKYEFPTSSAKPAAPPPRSSKPNPPKSSGVRPRTPSLRNNHLRPVTPNHLRSPLMTASVNTPSSSRRPPRLYRANSHGGSSAPTSPGWLGPVPKSAKRLARTAHLHEVKKAPQSALPKLHMGGKDDDVFSISTPRNTVRKGSDEGSPVDRVGIREFFSSSTTTPEVDTDAWEDTDASLDDGDL